MEYFNLQFVAILLALVSILLGAIAVSHHRSKPSCALPMMGLYHVFMNKTGLIHVTLGNMADKYGPIFSFPTGGHKALVVSTWEMAKECFTGNNDIVFSNRPMPLSFKIIFNAGGVDSAGLSQVPYGKYWRELRKICVHNLLSNQQLLKFRHLINSQVDTSFNKLYESCNKTKSSGNEGDSTTTVAGIVRMDDWLGELSFNVIGRIVCGFQSDTDTSATSSVERFTVAIDEASRFMSVPAVSDTFPWLGWIDRLTGLIKDMKHQAKKLDIVVESIIEDHRQKRRYSRTKKGDENNTEDEQDDFIDICLSIMEQPELPGNNYARQMPIKSIIVDMIGGATDTTKLTTIWTLSLLLNNPHVLDKAKEEVDSYFGTKMKSTSGEVMVDFDDIRNLVYIQAIIKESMRLYPASPVVERLSSEDCVVGGFHVPAGTRLWVNVWKVHRDPEVWDDPLVFRPERFLSNYEQKMVDVRGQHYELLPFGAGRRICPGISFSMDLMHLVLTRLILEFEMKSPNGEVDMTATQGLMSYKVVPLDIMLTRRML